MDICVANLGLISPETLSVLSFNGHFPGEPGSAGA